MTIGSAAGHIPAGAYDDLLARVLPVAQTTPEWSPGDGPMPALFVSHGAPPTLDDPIWLDDLHRWGRSLPRPRAIVIVSAHWENAPAAMSGSAAGTPLLYDFGGFHPRYYTLKYDTPDATDLARRLASLLGATGEVHRSTERGLDHGAFVPLMAMYPAADVPVVQLSMPSLEPEALLRLGTRLRPLRDEGILLIGSGFMTHSFAVMRQPELVAHAAAFDEWAADAVSRGDIDSLLDFRRKAPGVRIAHPTSDHFVPLLLAIGAADDPESATSVIDRFVLGNSTRSLQLL
ncbi:class III extradiol ring-cleavage dioxygenase [Rhodococcus ruber]|uniref:Class III extradiol ring-cleavage dioxygenase n=1 Tax=Rhodococcus ruber TaxID=1830 RepID=A0ABT4MEK2_9NOCA|nr:class III extradiol ring-cleavage dioxygenase [Rhodococcus ruber]MCZ4519416.1 class III extradiol ring-cleavage dioxygenase [Rhodococcus ruber]